MIDKEYRDRSLRTRVYGLIVGTTRQSATYGDLAALAGSPRAARIVGGIAHTGPDILPWHRLVNAEGGPAIGYPGGLMSKRQLLEQDGVECDDTYHVKNFWRATMTQL